MEETKSYKNINLDELNQSPKIVKKAAKVAMFVPRLLAKLSTKLVINPITKIYSGSDYEQVKNAAVDLTMQMQEAEAVELKEQIDEGVKNLNDWKDDRDYYIGNLASYNSYQRTIEKLSKKRNKLMGSPKRLLVAKNYFVVMKAFKEKNKEIKQNAKLVQQIVDNYQAKNDAVIAKKLEVKKLEEALEKARTELTVATEELNNYKEENYDIISQIPVVMGEAVEQEINEPVPTVEAEPVVTIVSPFAETPEVSVKNTNEVIETTPVVPEPTVEPVKPVQSSMPEFDMNNPMANLSQSDQDLLAQMGYFGGFSQEPNLEQGRSL